MKTKLVYLSLMICFFMFGCTESDDTGDDIKTNCDYTTIINAETFENAPADELNINNLEIDEDCLKISFSASGCDGNTWEVKLIDSGDVLESFPPQRNLRLSLENIELCDAMIIKELSFDLTNLQVEGDQVLLNITNSDNSILYEY